MTLEFSPNSWIGQYTESPFEWNWMELGIFALTTSNNKQKKKKYIYIYVYTVYIIYIYMFLALSFVKGAFGRDIEDTTLFVCLDMGGGSVVCLRKLGTLPKNRKKSLQNMAS